MRKKERERKIQSKLYQPKDKTVKTEIKRKMAGFGITEKALGSSECKMGTQRDQKVKNSTSAKDKHTKNLRRKIIQLKVLAGCLIDLF